jgi:hypothetical protein
MVPSLRESYNASFTEEKYKAFLDDLHSRFPGAIDFRVSETLNSFQNGLEIRSLKPVNT